MDGPSSPNDPHNRIHAIHDLLKQRDKCKYCHIALIPAPLRMNLSFHFCFLSFHPAVFDTNTLGFIPKDSDMNVIGKEGRENLDIFT